MGEETIIVLRDGTQVKFTPKAVKFMDELKEFFEVRGILEEDISLYLKELVRRNRARSGIEGFEEERENDQA